MTYKPRQTNLEPWPWDPHFALADDVRFLSSEMDVQPGLVCMVCGNCWCPLEMRRLADVDCPKCGALYADVAFNYEP